QVAGRLAKRGAVGVGFAADVAVTAGVRSGVADRRARDAAGVAVLVALVVAGAGDVVVAVRDAARGAPAAVAGVGRVRRDAADGVAGAVEVAVAQRGGVVAVRRNVMLHPQVVAGGQVHALGVEGSVLHRVVGDAQ